MRVHLALVPILVCCLGSLAAHGQTGEESTKPSLSWQMPTAIVTNVDKAGSVRGDFVSITEKLILTGLNNKSMTLTCTTHTSTGADKSQLNVGFDLDHSANVFRERMKLRQAAGNLRLGEKNYPIRFSYNPDTMKLAPADRSIARRMFNAGVRGDALKLKVLGKTHFDIVLPKPNQAFADFVNACPALQPKK